MPPKLFYLKERNNPQLDKPYYVACGQLSKREAKERENSLYGDNIMLAYETEKEYKNAIAAAKDQGFNVH